ncbi:MAG: hypothetical protein D6824_07665 [Planctomycetota bacterium]|nr:MAG: hypothetical protein D6824_07665 [Planctomycetota bacterium]
MRCSLTLFIFASLLAGGGVAALHAAGDQGAGVVVATSLGAALAALSGASVVAGRLIRRIAPINAGKTAGFLLMLLLGLWFTWRATDAARDAKDRQRALAKYQLLVRDGEVQDSDRALREHLQAAGVSVDDPAALATTLWTLAGLSFAALGVMVWALHKDSLSPLPPPRSPRQPAPA